MNKNDEERGRGKGAEGQKWRVGRKTRACKVGSSISSQSLEKRNEKHFGTKESVLSRHKGIEDGEEQKYATAAGFEPARPEGMPLYLVPESNT